MRNRTEMVTTTLPGSDNEEDASDLDDSEEDWKPADKKVLLIGTIIIQSDFV